MKTQAGIVAALVVASSLIAAIPIILQAPTAAAQGSTGVKTNMVDVEDNRFVPPEILVVKGTTVTWTHRGDVVHSITADTVEEFDHDPLLPPPLPARNTFEFTFDKLGKVEYHCNYHAGMAGSVTVVDKFEDPFVNVTATDNNTFNPPFVKLNASQGLVWTNVGMGNHSVTFEDAAVGDLGDLGPGATLNFTFAQDGSYRYRCKYHSLDFEEGMVGKVGVGANATFPGVIRIVSPKEGDLVNGTVNITGFVAHPVGEPPVTSVEVQFDGGDNWTVVDGVDNWSYSWDTTKVDEGPHIINVRAMAGTLEVAADGVNVTVDQIDQQGKDDGGGIPGFGILTLAPAVAVALWWRRRR